MPNKIISADEWAKGMLKDIKDATEMYQEETGCSKEKAQELANEVVNSIGRSLFYGDMSK